MQEKSPKIGGQAAEARNDKMTLTAYQAHEYREQQVMGASPVRIIVMTYDAAIRACEEKDLAQTTRAIGALRDALNFDAGEAALGFFALYQWCLECVRQDNYAEALKVLRGLREAWATVEKRLSPTPTLGRAPAQAQRAVLSVV